MVNDRLGRQQVKLGEFGMELADLVLTPGRRTELVMGDRRHHQEAGGGRVQAAIQPIGTGRRGHGQGPTGLCSPQNSLDIPGYNLYGG